MTLSISCGSRSRLSRLGRGPNLGVHQRDWNSSIQAPQNASASASASRAPGRLGLAVGHGFVAHQVHPRPVRKLLCATRRRREPARAHSADCRREKARSSNKTNTLPPFWWTVTTRGNKNTYLKTHVGWIIQTPSCRCNPFFLHYIEEQ